MEKGDKPISLKDFRDQVDDILANKVKEIRKSMGLSQEEFGELLGLERNTIGKREKRGETLTASELIIITAFMQQPDESIKTLIRKGKEIQLHLPAFLRGLFR